jgi:hypothetical protein
MWKEKKEEKKIIHSLEPFISRTLKSKKEISPPGHRNRICAVSYHPSPSTRCQALIKRLIKRLTTTGVTMLV